MAKQDRIELVDEAVEIFLALRSTPSDPSLLHDREAFLARGREERAIYEEVARAWQTAAVAGRRRRPKRRYAALAIVGVLAAAAYAGPDLYLDLSSDYRSEGAPARVELASGDLMHLDAGSAVEDDSDASARRIGLLRGAAFFDVAEDGRPFVVEAGDVTVSVLGTSFEVARAGDATVIGVTEGSVSVELNGETQTIGPGQRILATPSDGLVRSQIDPTAVASWREDRLIADGRSLRSLAAIVERRLSGPVVLLGEDFGHTRITGGFDLKEPVTALRAMAAATGARVVAMPPAMTLIIEPGFLTMSP
ncbi:MAG: FecR domain-containing protein [Pseudomonadota bacterium]